MIKNEINKANLEELRYTIEEARFDGFNAVFMEGVDDSYYYWEIGIRTGLKGISYYECSGKKGVLKYKKELSSLSSNKVKLVFFADKDIWIFTNTIPEEYEGIHFTHGYSFENDLFIDAYDSLMRDYRPEELEDFKTQLKQAATWFGFEAEALHNRRQVEGDIDSDFDKINIKHNKVFWKKEHDWPDFLQARKYSAPTGPFSEIQEEYHILQKIRGKYLWDIYAAILKNRDKSVDPNQKGLKNRAVGEGLANQNTNCRKVQDILRSTFYS